MKFHLKCCEWINMNRNARNLKIKSKKPKNELNETLYLLQIAGYRQSLNNFNEDSSKVNLNLNSSEALVACLTSDQIIQIYDQTNLKLKYRIVNSHITNSSKNINEIGFFKQTNQMIFSCGDDGYLKCWDLRTTGSSLDCEKSKPPTPAICIDYLKETRELLCADINLDDNLLVTGTNRNIDDSVIYIFDIRFNDRYLYKFCESHSKDITQVKFNPYRTRKFCSSSVDGLICLYDLDQNESEVKLDHKSSTLGSDTEDKTISDNDEDGDDQDEDPDLMEQVFNTDSSIQKLGYLYSNYMLNSPDQLYAITYTNGLFIWDLNTHDLIYKKESKSEEEEDYFFDCFYFKSKKDELPLLSNCLGDKKGNIKIIQNDEILAEINETNRNDQEDLKEMKKQMIHRDIIRSSFWDSSTSNLYTAGEDGFLIKWELAEKLRSLETKESNIKRERKCQENSDDETNFKSKKKHYETLKK